MRSIVRRPLPDADGACDARPDWPRSITAGGLDGTTLELVMAHVLLYTSLRMVRVARHMVRVGGLVTALLVGCGPEHPPFLGDVSDKSVPNGGVAAGGKSPQGGEATEAQGGETQGGEATAGSATSGSAARPPIDVGSATFDAAQVYLVTRLVNSPYLVLSPTSDLEQFTLGISSLFSSCRMQLQGDQLVYQEAYGPLRRFSPDVAGSPARKTITISGEELANNDPLVDTPACEEGEVDDFHTDPQGTLVYSCVGEPYLWYSGEELVTDDVFRVWALGNDGLAILDPKDGQGAHVRALAGGERFRVPELDERGDFLSEFAFRAHGDGFHAAAVRTGDGSHTPAELWEISNTGVVNVLGTYPALPNPNFGSATYALGPNDELYAYTFVSQVSYSLVRLTLAGDVDTLERAADSELLFEQRRTEPALVTGP